MIRKSSVAFIAVITGSYNWSAAAEEVNRENLVVLKDKGLASMYEQNFAAVWAASTYGTTTTTTVTTTTIPSTTTVTTSSTTTVTTTTATSPKILINEVELNPPGTDSGNEWVELYNPNSFAVDVSGYALSTTAGATVTTKIPAETMIGSNGYYIVTYSGQWLDNENESVTLANAAGVIIDSTPTLTDTANDNRAWQRTPNGVDTDSISDWGFTTATRASPN
jgi:hypothetical protein